MDTGIFFSAIQIGNFPAIFQRFSEARKKLLAFKWVLYPFKQAIFVNKQIKYKNRLEKKPM